PSVATKGSLRAAGPKEWPARCTKASSPALSASRSLSTCTRRRCSRCSIQTTCCGRQMAVFTPTRPVGPAPVRRPARAPASGFRARVETLGNIVNFSAGAIVRIPESTKYIREVWWYAAFLAIGSTPVALVLTYFTGSECSVEAYYSLSQIGAQSLAGVFNAICDTREITPLFFGFAIGAKVGCGLVAVLGSIGATEQIDALEVMGIHSKVYLVSTRMLACFIVLPFMYLLSL